MSLLHLGLSGGAIAGIVIAIIILLVTVVLVGLIIFYILYKNKRYVKIVLMYVVDLHPNFPCSLMIWDFLGLRLVS